MFVNNKCIKYFTDELTWPDANAFCQGMSGSLVVFHTAQELTNVVNKVLPPTYQVWVGLSDLETSRVWKWVDNTALSFDAWREGEPSNVNSRCVNFLNGFFSVQWAHNFNDDSCNRSHDFICQKPPSV